MEFSPRRCTAKPTVGFSKYVKVRNYCYARGLIIRRSSTRGRIWWLPFRRRCYCYNTGLQVTKAEHAVPAFVYTTRSYPTANAIPMADTTSALLHPISVYYVQCIMFGSVELDVWLKLITVSLPLSRAVRYTARLSACLSISNFT